MIKKLNLTAEEQEALDEAWKVRLPEETMANYLAELRIMESGKKELIEKFFYLLNKKYEADQRRWREWFINSGLIRAIILNELKAGKKGLAKRISTDWGQLVNRYDLKKHFNKTYTDVINNTK